MSTRAVSGGCTTRVRSRVCVRDYNLGRLQINTSGSVFRWGFVFCGETSVKSK